MAEAKKDKLIFKKGEDLKGAKKALKVLGLSKEEVDKMLVQMKKAPVSFPVSLKFAPADAETWKAYISLAIDEKQTSGKTVKAAGSEIALFAVKKLMKSEAFLHEKIKTGYKAKTDEDRKKGEKKSK